MKAIVYLMIMATVAAGLSAGQASAAGDGMPSDVSSGERQMLAYADPAARSRIALKALAADRSFRPEPDLFTESAPSGSSADAGIIGVWSERVFESLGSAVLPRPVDAVDMDGLKSRGELDAEAGELRTVTRVAMKETVKIALEHLPELDRIVKALRFEVSTDMLAGEEKTDGETGPAPDAAGSAAPRRSERDERFLLRTGLRVPIEGGRIGLLSETEAVYGKISSFLRMRFDGSFDSGMGLAYDFGSGAQIQVERQVVHEADRSGNSGVDGRSVSNVVRLVYAF